MKLKKLLSLVLAMMMVWSLGVAGAETITEIPRNEALYFAGQQWGAVNSWNPLNSSANSAMTIAEAGSGSRVTMFETLYMYNFLDGTMVPLLADGDYVWNEDQTEMTIKINPAAKWNDGTPVTAHDVAATFETAVAVEAPVGIGYAPFIEEIVAEDDLTVVIKSTITDGMPTNPLQVLTFIGQAYILQEAWLTDLSEKYDGDPTAMKNDDGEGIPFSGPYSNYFADDSKVVLVRNDEYWGQDESMWGKLPAPKYLVHNIFTDNDSALKGLVAGEVDVAQLFIANVQNLWLEQDLPISTYMSEAPYGICVNMPTAWFNLSSFGLDNVAVRKAIAIAVDFDSIIANAMTNQSPTFADVPRSCMNPTDGEQAAYDHDAVADLQWVGNDIEGAIALLDEAGVVDTDGDGWREIDGTKLSYNACCPNGWSDWMAAMEIVAAAGEKIGIEITTNFPEWSAYQPVVYAAEQSEYDIFMMATESASPAQPWSRIRQMMSSEYNGIEGNMSGNFGHYENARLDELLKLIPLESDPDQLKAYYTECVEIYLTEVPSFSLMYRPDKFHTVNETIWTNYPDATDGRNIPPADCTDGYGIAALYDLELVNP